MAKTNVLINREQVIKHFINYLENNEINIEKIPKEYRDDPIIAKSAVNLVSDNLICVDLISSIILFSLKKQL